MTDIYKWNITRSSYDNEPVFLKNLILFAFIFIFGNIAKWQEG